MLIPHEWSGALAGAAQSLIVLGVAYVARTAFSLNRRLERVERILTGEDGANGLRSTVNEIKEIVGEHTIKQARHSTRIEKLEQELDRVRESA